MQQGAMAGSVAAVRARREVVSTEHGWTRQAAGWWWRGWVAFASTVGAGGMR